MVNGANHMPIRRAGKPRSGLLSPNPSPPDPGPPGIEFPISQISYQFILVTFDPTATAISGTTIPDPLSLLDHAFFVLLETVNGDNTASAVAYIPEPSSVALLALGGLATLWLKFMAFGNAPITVL